MIYYFIHGEQMSSASQPPPKNYYFILHINVNNNVSSKFILYVNIILFILFYFIGMAS